MVLEKPVVVSEEPLLLSEAQRIAHLEAESLNLGIHDQVRDAVFLPKGTPA